MNEGDLQQTVFDLEDRIDDLEMENKKLRAQIELKDLVRPISLLSASNNISGNRKTSKRSSESRASAKSSRWYANTSNTCEGNRPLRSSLIFNFDIWKQPNFLKIAHPKLLFKQKQLSVTFFIWYFISWCKTIYAIFIWIRNSVIINVFFCI